MKKKIKVKTPEDDIIKRVPRFERFGNFVHIIIRYNNKEYYVGDGDEYLRGMPEIFELDLDKEVK